MTPNRLAHASSVSPIPMRLQAQLKKLSAAAYMYCDDLLYIDTVSIGGRIRVVTYKRTTTITNNSDIQHISIGWFTISSEY